ncbi:gpW family head-tail joining protein [Methylobacterium planeticum]|uniref:Uncharacterized protein n=1 Tax=Methylobacterium planeticum TaxID=2615211 RepID=A0A6N6MH77_9HYPH|nr:gpW family head-tail joining protein [Methylobacterium planeticum]KAB1069249.1 hypothetical protein F6X51_25585 [Methylobacterium planeticum]
MADLATLSLRLSQAEDALHKVATGHAVELITEDGSTVRYAKVNQDKLEIYIATLRDQIAGLVGVRVPRRAPIHLSF